VGRQGPQAAASTHARPADIHLRGYAALLLTLLSLPTQTVLQPARAFPDEATKATAFWRKFLFEDNPGEMN